MYEELKDVDNAVADTQQQLDKVRKRLTELAEADTADTDESVLLFPDRRRIVLHHPSEQTASTASKYAHMEDSTDTAKMYRIREQDVWQAPFDTWDDLLQAFRSVVGRESPQLEEWMHRRWEKAHAFVLKTHPEGFSVLEADTEMRMENVAKRHLEHNTHYVSFPSDKQMRVKKDGEPDVLQTMYDAGWPVQDLREKDAGRHLDISTSIDLRSYQQEWVDRFMERGNGVFVGPPGSGKTIAGIGVIEEVSGDTLILVPRRELVDQWRDEILDHTDLSAAQIGEYHGDIKNLRPVTIATYQTVSSSRHKNVFHDRDWGLIVYDEVHHIPSRIFKRTTNLHSKHRLGLTATPVREDNNEDKIFTLVGPEIGTDWRQLFEDGYVSMPDIEVHFINWNSTSQRNKYQKADGHDKRVLAAQNPAKDDVIEELLHRHKHQPVLMFVDWLDQGRKYSKLFDVPFICGESSRTERREALDQFKDGELSTLILSRIGDEGIDLPNAEVAVMASGLGGSRRQGGQRAGRTMRPDGSSKAYFLATKGSNEQDFMQRQTQHLQEKGVDVSVHRH